MVLCTSSSTFGKKRLSEWADVENGSDKCGAGWPAGRLLAKSTPTPSGARVRRPDRAPAASASAAAAACRYYWPAVAWFVCLSLASFNVYYTWCLHDKIATLERRVDASAAAGADLLLDKSDVPFSGGIVGRPTSADEDQEVTEELPGDEDSLAGLFASDGSKVEYDYDDQHVPSDEDKDDGDGGDGDGDDEDDDEYSPSSSTDRPRQKRQVDLSSHTQDGVPIFDQGYGVASNRTEGLRIYQSLLANGGRGEPRSPDANWRATDAPPILPHHRENSFWRGRKEKARHHHQHGKLSVQPTVELDEHFELDQQLQQQQQQQVARSNRTRHRPAGSSSVEFRSSRVKPSATETGSVISSSMVQSDQKAWPRASSSPGLGGSPFSSDERISAATAPAVLTKSASAASAAAAAAAAAASSGRSRAQHSVFRVTQPSSVPPLSPTPVPVDNRDDAPARTSPMPPVKKRVNKKQLRDLSHTASAVHLVADTRNASSADNQVEIASRNELGLHTSWKMAPGGEESAQKTPLVKIDGAILTVKQSGLYFIYSQVHYLDEHGVNAYEVFVNTEPFLRCVTSSDASASASASPKPNTCYTAGASVLREGDKLFLRDIEPLRYSVLQPSKTFFGLIRLAPVSDFP